MKKHKLAKVLKALLEDREISARELSRATKVPQATITSFLSGRSSNKPEHLLAIAEYFNVSLEFLLFGIERHQEPGLSSILTEGIYEGWLKVKIERAIPDKRRLEVDD